MSYLTLCFQWQIGIHERPVCKCIWRASRPVLYETITGIIAQIVWPDEGHALVPYT